MENKIIKKDPQFDLNEIIKPDYEDTDPDNNDITNIDPIPHNSNCNTQTYKVSKV